MSVLKNFRSVSRAEFVNTASEIVSEVTMFLTRLSSRYSRVVSEPTISLAYDMLDNAARANSIKVTDELTKALRLAHLYESRSALISLDVHLFHCLKMMYRNPQGCFTVGGKKNNITPSEAEKRLDSLAQRLGDMINLEQGLINGNIDMVRKIEIQEKSRDISLDATSKVMPIIQNQMSSNIKPGNALVGVAYADSALSDAYGSEGSEDTPDNSDGSVSCQNNSNNDIQDQVVEDKMSGTEEPSGV